MGPLRLLKYESESKIPFEVYEEYAGDDDADDLPDDAPDEEDAPEYEENGYCGGVSGYRICLLC